MQLVPVVPIVFAPLLIVVFAIVFPIWVVALAITGILWLLAWPLGALGRARGNSVLIGIADCAARLFHWTLTFGGIANSRRAAPRG